MSVQGLGRVEESFASVGCKVASQQEQGGTTTAGAERWSGLRVRGGCECRGSI